MGLEGVDYMDHRMESFTQLTPLLGGEKAGILSCGLQSLASVPAAEGAENEAKNDGTDSLEGQLQILFKAQELLRKSELYQKIDQLMKEVHDYRPVLDTLPIPGDDDEDRVTRLHRDAAAHNLRFLNIFYGYSPSSFSLAINLFDRLLGKVKASAKYMSCIAMSCFHIAIRATMEESLPTVAELIKLSQCGGSVSDLQRMERLVLEKLQYLVPGSVTPLTFLFYFVELVADRLPCFREPVFITSLVAKLEVLTCQFEFARVRAEVLALALLSYVLQELCVDDLDLFTTLVEVQYYCQISDSEFLSCRELLIDYLHAYYSQRSRLPRLRLNWSVSRRTLNKMRPSTRCILDLEPIFEDEADEEEIDDAGPFDSENEHDCYSPIITGPNLHLEDAKPMITGTGPKLDGAKPIIAGPKLHLEGAKPIITGPKLEGAKPSCSDVNDNLCLQTSMLAIACAARLESSSGKLTPADMTGDTHLMPAHVTGDHDDAHPTLAHVTGDAHLTPAHMTGDHGDAHLTPAHMTGDHGDAHLTPAHLTGDHGSRAGDHSDAYHGVAVEPVALATLCNEVGDHGYAAKSASSMPTSEEEDD